MPPWPGIISPKSYKKNYFFVFYWLHLYRTIEGIEIVGSVTLILKARLKPDAKNPPNGPITELKMLIDRECNKNG